MLWGVLTPNGASKLTRIHGKMDAASSKELESLYELTTRVYNTFDPQR